MNNRPRAVFFLILVNLLWGLSFPIAKALNLQLDQHFAALVDPNSALFRISAATWVIALRFSAAFVLFAIVFRSVLLRATIREWKAGSIIGAIFLTGLILQVIGLATIPASRSGFLTSLTVVFTPLVGSIIHGRRPSIPVLIGVFLSIIGVAILTGLIVVDSHGVWVAQDAMNAWTTGDTLTVISTLFFTCQILCIDYFAKSLKPSAFTPGMFLTISVFAWLLFLVSSNCIGEKVLSTAFLAPSFNVSFASLILILAAFPSLLSFSWMNTYQPHVTAVQAAVIYTLEPVFVTTWALFLPGVFHLLWGLPMANELLTAPIFIGGAVILLANVLALRPNTD